MSISLSIMVTKKERGTLGQYNFTKSYRAVNTICIQCLKQQLLPKSVRVNLLLLPRLDDQTDQQVASAL